MPLVGLFLIIFTSKEFSIRNPRQFGMKKLEKGVCYFQMRSYYQGRRTAREVNVIISFDRSSSVSEEPTTCALAFFKLNKQKYITFFFSLLIKTHPFTQFWQVIQFKSVKFHDLYRLIFTTTFADTIFFLHKSRIRKKNKCLLASIIGKTESCFDGLIP